MRLELTGIVLIGTMSCAVPCLAGGGASFTLLPTHTAYDVTVDEFGRTLVVTGGSGLGGQGDYYIYDVDADTYTYLGVGWARGISADGTSVIGSSEAVDGWIEAVRWTDVGPEFLGGLGGLCDSSRSSGFAISGDGSTAIGLASNADCSAPGFMWTAEEGMQQLELLALPYAPYQRASVISDDGQVIGGFAQGTGNRSPAIWNAADRTGSFINVDAEGEIGAISPDGRMLGGEYYLHETMGGTALDTGWKLPFYWTAESGVVILPWATGTGGGSISGISASKRTFVGRTDFGSGRQATVTRPEWGGTHLLKDKLIELGVTNLDDVSFGTAMAVSDDGTVVVGWANVPGEEFIETHGFVATLPDELPVPCDEDLDGDGSVGFADLTQILNAWGPCVCPEDLNGDAAVGFADLTQLLNTWGPCS